MAKVKITGHASGTGVLTVTAPNTSTDRTITLPDATGTLATTADTFNPDAAVTINESGADVDFRVESDTNANMLFVDGSEDKVGIGTNAPARILHVSDTTSGATTGIRLTGANNGSQVIEFADTDDTNVGYIQYNHNNNRISLRAADANILNIDSDGLKFNADTAAANALDDYEYGTWTPANQWITLTNNATARYVKIGSLVTVWGNVTWASSPADTSQTGGKIQGLPYTPVGGDFPWLPSHWVNTTTGARKDDSEYDYYLSTDTTMIIYSRPNSRVLQRQQVSGTNMKFIATFTTD